MLLSIGPRAASRRYSAGLSLREGSLGLGDGVLNRGEERLARDGGAGHAVDVGGVSLYDLAGAVKVRDGLAVDAEHPRASERRSKYPASRPKPALPTCTPSLAYITRTTYWITLTSELRGGELSQKELAPEKLWGRGTHWFLAVLRFNHHARTGHGVLGGPCVLDGPSRADFRARFGLLSTTVLRTCRTDHFEGPAWFWFALVALVSATNGRAASGPRPRSLRGAGDGGPGGPRGQRTSLPVTWRPSGIAG